MDTLTNILRSLMAALTNYAGHHALLGCLPILVASITVTLGGTGPLTENSAALVALVVLAPLTVAVGWLARAVDHDPVDITEPWLYWGLTVAFTFLTPVALLVALYASAYYQPDITRTSLGAVHDLLAAHGTLGDWAAHAVPPVPNDVVGPAWCVNLYVTWALVTMGMTLHARRKRTVPKPNRLTTTIGGVSEKRWAGVWPDALA